MAAVWATLPLAACSTKMGPNFCKAESRKLDDTDLKARALANILLAGDKNAQLPYDAKQFLNRAAPGEQSFDTLRRVFIDYVKANPLCCQIRKNLTDWYDYSRLYEAPPSKSGQMPLGTLYILSSHQSRVEFADSSRYYRQANSTPYLDSFGPIYGCGEFVAIKRG